MPTWPPGRHYCTRTRIQYTMNEADFPRTSYPGRTVPPSPLGNTEGIVSHEHMLAPTPPTFGVRFPTRLPWSTVGRKRVSVEVSGPPLPFYGGLTLDSVLSRRRRRRPRRGTSASASRVAAELSTFPFNISGFTHLDTHLTAWWPSRAPRMGSHGWMGIHGKHGQGAWVSSALVFVWSVLSLFSSLLQLRPPQHRRWAGPFCFLLLLLLLFSQHWAR